MTTQKPKEPAGEKQVLGPDGRPTDPYREALLKGAKDVTGQAGTFHVRFMPFPPGTKYPEDKLSPETKTGGASAAIPRGLSERAAGQEVTTLPAHLTEYQNTPPGMLKSFARLGKILQRDLDTIFAWKEAQAPKEIQQTSETAGTTKYPASRKPLWFSFGLTDDSPQGERMGWTSGGADTTSKNSHLSPGRGSRDLFVFGGIQTADNPWKIHFLS